MNRVRAALVARDVKTAAKQLELAAENAHTTDERQQVTRMRALVQEYVQFLSALRAGIKKLEPAEELPIDDSFVSVVEFGDDKLSVFEEGSRHDYTLANMPVKIALVVSERAASPEFTKVKLFVGAFLAVEPKGDRARARRLWEAAAVGRSRRSTSCCRSWSRGR